MKRTTPDVIDWNAALEGAATQARDLRPAPTPPPDVACLCGSTDPRGRITTTPVDLTDADVTCRPNEGGRPCRACQHYIHHGAMCVVRRFERTTTVRDHFHPNCVRL